MKSILLTLSIIFSLTQTSAQGVWTQKHYVGYAYNGEPCWRDMSVGFSIGTKGYMCTGEMQGPIYTTELWEFDAILKTWTQKASLPGVARINAIGFSIGSKGYVGTGQDGAGNALSDFWEYDQLSDTWTRRADFAGVPRVSAVCIRINNKGYIGTGTDANVTSLYNDFWEYDPASNIWTQKANFGGSPRSNALGFSIGSKGYVGTGDDGSLTYRNDIWQYDPVTDAWSFNSNVGNGTSGGEACSINGKGYVAGGLYVSGTSNEIWEFDTATSMWTYKRDLVGSGMTGKGAFSVDTIGFFLSSGNYSPINEYHPLANEWAFNGRTRYSAVGFCIGNKGYIGGGSQEDFGPLTDLWEYDLGTDSWVQKAGCTALGNFGLLNLMVDSPSAYILVGAINQLWQYRQDSNVWIRKADFPGTGNSACAFFIDSLGYAGTGIDTNGNATKDFWSYNPRTNIWTRKNDFAGSARLSAVGFSINHKGYIGTGSSANQYSNYIPSNDFWEYDPNADSWTQKADVGNHVRTAATGFSIGNRGYIGTGGFDSNSATVSQSGWLKDFWEYNPYLNQWTEIPNMSLERDYAVGFAIGNNGYIGTGLLTQASCNLPNTNDFWEYSPIICTSITQALCIVSIDTSINKPLIIWEKANKYATDSFYIFRTNTPDSIYLQIASIGRDSLSLWKDTSAHPELISYRYKIAILDTCGSFSDLSPYHQTIFLSSPGQGQFVWTPYLIEGAAAPAGTYGLYRDSLGNGDWQLLMNLSNTQTSASDPNFASYPNARYQIIITLNNPCNPTRSNAVIHSNIISRITTNGMSNACNLNSIKIHPNPVKDQLTITNPNASEISIMIANTLGQIIYSSSTHNESYAIDSRGWENGVYFVTVSSFGSSLTAKILK